MEHVNLVELAGDVWNFDLEGYLDFFKESHERLIEIEDWRIESDQKTFPLGEEEIKGVADGLEVLKALENIDVIMKMWEKLKKLENDMKWISAKTELKNVINRLPEQPIDSKLAYLHEGFSRIHSEFGYFLYESLKLQKMKKGVEKYEKWIKKQSCLVDGPKKCNNIPDELMKHVEL
uniref:Uncharacterized protein n=1 Tax=Caenorhabditis tropicalis TaxID=1561998 RepID=A0A1I7UDP1_9PELO